MNNYSLNLGILTPNSAGNFYLSELSDKTGIGLFKTDQSERWRYGYPIGNGLFSIMSTEPRKNYRKLSSLFVPHKNGQFKIIGAYPFYRASNGEPVFLDVCRTFSTAPVDFRESVNRYFSERAQARATIRIAKKQRVIRKGRFTYRISNDPDSTSYLWSARFGGKEFAKGKSETKVGAERFAERAIRQERLAMLLNVR